MEGRTSGKWWKKVMTRGGNVGLWIPLSPFLEPCPSTSRPLDSMSLVAFSSASHPTIMIHHWSMTEGLLSPLKATYVCVCAHSHVCDFLLICSSEDVVRPRSGLGRPQSFTGLHSSLWLHTLLFVLAHESWMEGISRGCHEPGAFFCG